MPLATDNLARQSSHQALTNNHPDRRASPSRLSRYTDAKAAGLTTRRGVPNGWAGRGEEAAAARAQAQEEGWAVVQHLNRNAQLPEERLEPDRLNDIQGGAVPVTDTERAAVAMAVAMSFVLSPTLPASKRLRAARTVLPYLIPMPTRVSRKALEDGMEFIDRLVADVAGANDAEPR